MSSWGLQLPRISTEVPLGETSRQDHELVLGNIGLHSCYLAGCVGQAKNLQLGEWFVVVKCFVCCLKCRLKLNSLGVKLRAVSGEGHKGEKRSFVKNAGLS